jgi:transaldolase
LDTAPASAAALTRKGLGMGRLQALHTELGQSPWLDNLKRGYLTSGELQRWVDRGVRGITSNPTIFEKAISAGTDYDDEFRSLITAGDSVTDSYWKLVTHDIEAALAILRPVYDASDGVDGFVSIEVAPGAAFDTDATMAQARQLHATIGQPNLYVKIPGTAAGLPAIQQMISEGHSINVTLLFSLERYGDVIEAYLAGLEAAGPDVDLAHVSSVASFFVSRVDTEVDRRLEAIGTDRALALRGQAAVANAKLAYQLFTERFSGPRWEALAARGARVQRPLWASTSSKNPSYPDTIYVDGLIGPNTVNTMPDATLEAFDDHGRLERTVDADVDGARAVIAALAEVGLDLADVTRTLEEEGVASFAKSFDELLESLGAKAHAITS